MHDDSRSCNSSATMDEYDAKSSDPSASAARNEGLDKKRAKSSDKDVSAAALLVVAAELAVAASPGCCGVLLLWLWLPLLPLLAAAVVNWRDARGEGSTADTADAALIVIP